MAVLRRDLLAGVATALMGLAGVTVLGRCGGRECTSCLACVAPGAAVLLVALSGKVHRREGREVAPPPATRG